MKWKSLKMQPVLSIVQGESVRLKGRPEQQVSAMTDRRTFPYVPRKYCVVFLDNFSLLPCMLALLSFLLEESLLKLPVI